MSLPKMATDVDNISKLDTRPNAVNGLTADQLKAEFDKGPAAIKAFLNNVLIPALDKLTAENIAYQGTISGYPTQNVSDAIDILQMGAPLDMTADYEATGASSVAKWAAMAGNSSASYHIGPGRYQITADDYVRNVIISDWGGGVRSATVIEYTDDQFVYLTLYGILNPGDQPFEAVYFSTDEYSGFLSVQGGATRILPYYDNNTGAGKVLMTTGDGNAEWQALPTYTGGVSG